MAAISPITLVFNAVDQASPVIKGFTDKLREIKNVTKDYNDLRGAFSDLMASGKQAYDLLIGQNVRLQEQLLGTKASLVATNKILENGLEIKDPTKAIKALNEPVNQAIKSLREGSLELVGVTSAELVPIYQLVAQNAGAISISLQQASDLTLDFSAALGTLGIPLFQAREEINSILTGNITLNTRLAKSLDINNAQVAAWKAQGVLVERLTGKLAAFRAGNALAAQTINGVTSNIEEVVQEITRIAGEPLLAPIVVQLTNLYNYLKQNKDAIQDIAVSVVNFFLGIGEKLGEVFTILEPVFKTLGESLFKQISAEASAAGKVITVLVDSFVLLVQAAAPLLQIIANISSVFADFASTDLGGLILQAGIAFSILSQFAPVLIAIQLAFIIARTAALVFWAAVNGSPTALAALNAIAPTLATITAAFVTAGGGVAGFTAAMAAASVAAKAFLVSLIPIMVALTPLIAIGGTIAISFAVIQTEKIKDAEEALDLFRKQGQLSGDQAIDTAQKLSVLNKAFKENGTLTKQQEADLKRLQNTAKLRVAQIQDEIKYLKEQNFENAEQRNARDTEIAQRQRLVNLLNKQAGGVSTAALDLQKLGNDYQQLAEKVRNATAQFNRPVSVEIFKNAAKEIVDFTSKQFEAGGVSAKLAIENLERVRNDIRLEYDQRVAAQEAIIKIRQTETDRRVKIVENEQQQIQTLIANQVLGDAEGQRQISANKIKQLNIQLEAVRKNIAEETKLRNSQINVQVADIDKKIVDAEKKKAEAEKAGNKQETRLANEDIAGLQAQKAAAKTALNLNNEKLLQQKNQETKFANEISQERGKERQRLNKEVLKDFDEQQSILESSFSSRLITQEQFNQQSLDISQKRATAELKQLETERKKLSDKDTEGLEAIAVRQSAVRKKLTDDIEKFEQGKSQIRLAKIDTEQKELAAKLAAGSVSEQQFYAKSFELTKKRLQAELDEVNRQKSKLKPGDSRLDLLNAQAEDIRKRQLDAVADNQDKQLVILDKAQKKATDIVSQSEAERNITVAKLEKDKLITGAKANELRVDNTRKTLESELALEKDKLAELLALPAYSDPIKEETRQSQIRASRKKTTDLTKSLIDNEVQKREAVFKVFEDIKNKEIQAIQNQANAQTQLLDNQLKLNDYAAKNLSIQEDLLRSRQDLISAGTDYLTGELQILAELTDNEDEKKAIAESIALVRLKSVQEQAVFERKILELNIEQTAEALKQERIALRIETLKARASTLKAQAEEEKTNKNRNATKGEKEAAALNTDAAIQTEGLLREQADLLDNKEFSNQRKAEYSRIKLRDSSQLREDQALLNLANSRVDKSLGKREKERLGSNIRNRRYTGDDGSGGSLRINENTGRNLRFIRRETDFDLEKFNSDGSLRNPQGTQNNNLEGREATRDEIRLALEQALGRSLGTPNQDPQKQLIQDTLKTRQFISSQLPVVNTQPIPQTRFTGNVPQNTLVNKDGQLASNVGGSSFTVNITNTFNPADVASGKAASQLGDQVRKEFYDILTLASKK